MLPDVGVQLVAAQLKTLGDLAALHCVCKSITADLRVVRIEQIARIACADSNKQMEAAKKYLRIPPSLAPTTYHSLRHVATLVRDDDLRGALTRMVTDLRNRIDKIRRCRSEKTRSAATIAAKKETMAFCDWVEEHGLNFVEKMPLLHVSEFNHDAWKKFCDSTALLDHIGRQRRFRAAWQ